MPDTPSPPAVSSITVPTSLVGPDDHMGPIASAGCVYGLGWVGWLALFVTALVLRRQWTQRTNEARARYRPGRFLAAGETLLEGRVEFAEDADLAIRTEIDQDGTESESSGVWSHTWKERRRRMQVKPFYLDTGAERVRVEPDRDVLFLDEMDRTLRVNLTSRVRVAELTPGERVYAHGVLAEWNPERRPRGRDEVRWVLRPGKEMEISALPLGERARRRAARHARFALGYALTGIAWHLLVAGVGYYRLQWDGVPGTATVNATEERVTQDDEGDDVYSWYANLTMTTPPAVAGRPWIEEIDESLFDILQVGMTLPARAVPDGTAEKLGASATLNTWLGFLAWMVLLAQGILHGVYARRPVGWFEGPLEEGGSGRLSETP